MKLWPLIFRRDYDALKTENFTLRSALRDAHDELARHRRLIAGLRSGEDMVTRAVDRVIGQSK